MHIRHIGFLTVALAGITLGPPASQADWGCINEYDGTTYQYFLCNVPDLDQLRGEGGPFVSGLPNDGAMYCAPTAAMNWVIYLANHGYPDMTPGPGDFGPEPEFDEPMYELATQALLFMGAAMGTDPVNGTTGGMASGLTAWLESQGTPGDFTVVHAGANGGYCPTLDEMALAAVNGSLVIPVVGFYKPFDELSPAAQAWWMIAGTTSGLLRGGGHVMTLVGADNVGGVRTIGVHDPWKDEDYLYTQSSFATESYEADLTLGLFNGNFRLCDHLPDLSETSYLDEYAAIVAKYGFTTDGSSLFFLKPIQFHLDSGTMPKIPYQAFPTGNGKKVTAVAIRPQGWVHPYLTEGDSTIWQVDAFTGRSSRFARANNPQALAFGDRGQHLYVLQQREVVSYDRDGRLAGRIAMRDGLSAIAYDRRSDRLVVLADDLRRLWFLDPDLRAVSSVPIPLPRWHATESMAVDAHGVVWVHLDGSPSIWRIEPGGPLAPTRATEVVLKDGQRTQGLAVDDQGLLYVSNRGTMAVYSPTGARLSSKFAGLPAGPTLDIHRSFTNLAPGEHDGLPWRNELPPEHGR